ncbi:hypothetical protein RQP46_008830 [Phenoliferia psychrophenolica]
MPRHLRSQPPPPRDPTPPPLAPTFELLASEVLLEIFQWALFRLDPLARQRCLFKLAKVCHQWHAALQLLEPEFAVQNHKQARHLAHRFKTDGTGASVVKLYLEVDDRVQGAVALLRECTQLRALRLVAPIRPSYFTSGGELETAIKERKSACGIGPDAPPASLSVAAVLDLLAPLAPHLLDFEWDPVPMRNHFHHEDYLSSPIDLSSFVALRRLELGAHCVHPGTLSTSLSNLPHLEFATVHLGAAQPDSWTSEGSVQDIGDCVASAGALKRLRLVPNWTSKRFKGGQRSGKFSRAHHWDKEQLEWMEETARENGVELVVSHE